VLSNLYLNDVDRMLERAQDATRRGAYTYVEYARFADDLVIRRFDSQPVGRVVQLINPILRGWVNYFAFGNASRCFNLSKTGWRRRCDDS
jgi:Group II intron, maturase-specific domain